MLLQKRFSVVSPYNPSTLVTRSPTRTSTIHYTVRTPRIQRKNFDRSPKKSSTSKGIKLPEILSTNSKISEISEEAYSGIKIQQVRFHEDQEDSELKVGYSSTLGSFVVCRQFAIDVITKKRLQLYRKVGQNQHVIQLLGSHSKKQDKYQNVVSVITERAIAGDLCSTIKNFGNIRLVALRKFIEDLLTGLSHIHSKKIVHMDLRAKNILIDSQNKVKIGGWFKKCEVSHSKIQGVKKIQQLTPYTPPQCILIQKFEANYSYDIWSVGCLIVELYSGKALSLTPKISLQQRKQQLLDNSFYSKHLVNDPCQLKTVVTRCFDKSPSNRPKAAQLLKMKFFTHSNQ